MKSYQGVVTDVYHDGCPISVLPYFTILLPQSCLMFTLSHLFYIFQFPFHFILNPVLFLVGSKDPAFWPESVSPYYALPTGERYVIIFLFLIIIIIIKHIYLISTLFIAVFFIFKFSFCYSMGDNAVNCLVSCFLGIL